MKIISLKIIKPEIYEVIFDNGIKINLYEDVIVNNNITNKEIDDALYDLLLKQNDEAKVLFDAIKYIEKKLRSEKEVRDYLYSKQLDINVELIIDKLKKLKLIDDVNFAKSYTNDKYNISKYGLYKIINGLQEHNINEGVIYDATSFITEEEELDRINKIVLKYLRTNKKDSFIKLKNKILNNLVDKGYSKELVYKVLNNIKIDNSNALKKQYDKLYKKYSIKYKDEELVKVISMNLQKQGFTYDEIKKLEI